MTTLNKNYTKIQGTDAVKTIDDTNSTQIDEIEVDMETIETDLTTLQTNNTGTNTGDGAEKDTAQWNASKIQGKTVDDSGIGSQKVLAYNATSGNIEYQSPGTPSAHSSSHESGGGDEISVAGLSGELADNQPPKAHESSHEPLGSDSLLLDEDDMASNSATKGASQQSIKAYTDAVKLFLLNMPEGTLVNGKIVPSVASDDLTVAIKTLAGTDPSTSDPVYVRIGDTVRSITSALSITRTAGTNHFNSGSDELATNEVDYFVYLGYNASNGVKLGVSRKIGYVLDDFVVTQTNENYLVGYSSFSSGDALEVIGRFAATLSAGAGYTWSVPTFTTKNLIQRPIFETRLLDYTPTLVVSGGTVPTYTDTYINKYKIVGNRCLVDGVWNNTSGGTAGAGANILYAHRPFNVSSDIKKASRTVLGSGIAFDNAQVETPIIVRWIDNAKHSFFYTNTTPTSGTSIKGQDQSEDSRYIVFHLDYAI